ncbi:hypothetical protein [Terrimonas pollutisoli]|uniref:hypothetical protein n=1 Tax=Terrimonas pollutisoli TaxID=3034147 RepID=UPI0023EC69B8|nr:hypothetical protein [Terrimonas sp. H1YJ31]
MNEIFQALNKEAVFTNEMLASGATQIRKANYADKGFYFQAFTALSTGLERIGKLCLMLDYYIKHNGTFPNLDALKRDIGHDIRLLYFKSKEIIVNRTLSFIYLDNLDNPVHQNIIDILSNFAKGDRYSNINLLTTQTRNIDPISEWSERIDMVLFKQNVSSRKRDEIERNAQIAQQLLGSFAHIIHTSERNKPINSIQNASFLTGMNNAVRGLRQFYVAQIIRYWVELLEALQYQAMALGKQEIPYMGESFVVFLNSDKYLKSRKDFVRIR